MYDYSRYAIRKKLKPHTKRMWAGKILSTVLKLIALVTVVCVVGAGIYAFVRWNSLVESAPDISGVTFTPGESATYIYNQEGKRVQKLTLPEANRDLVSLSEVPEDLQHAVVAIEDARFYEHNGIDPIGIVRALALGLKSGSFSQGASTITQQLLKNSVFPGWTQETTFQQRIERKIQEQYLALKLERIQSKDQILENYLNLINLGAGCYGVQAAAYRYFGKPVRELTLSEDAVIAGITQNPTAYNPIIYPENNAKRRKMVLDAMLDQGYIDKQRYDEAMADDVYGRILSNVSSVDTSSTIYTFYQDALIAQVMQDLQDELAYTYQQAYRMVYSGGLRIYSAQDEEVQAVCDAQFENPENFPEDTKAGIDYALSVQSEDLTQTDYGNEDFLSWVRSTSDPDFNMMYDTADEAKAAAAAFRESVVKEGDTVLGERVTITPQPQASCVVIDQFSGRVLALVGGRGDKEASLTLNRASYTTRQPGSTFKILTTYAPALEKKAVTLASTIVDEPYDYSFGLAVNNATHTYQGEVTVREAIAQSINVAAVKLLTAITPQVGYDYAEKFGIRTMTQYLETSQGVLTDVSQTLALGGISRGVTNLDLTGAYAAIANMGQYYVPKFYTEVFDQYGNVILDNTSQKPRTVIEPGTAQLLTSAMEDVIKDEAGTAHGLIDLGVMPAAGKTGTTSDWRDSWFVGYTPYYTCGIWAGYDNNSVMPDEGRFHSFSKILWNSIMNDLNDGKMPASFDSTGDVTKVRICAQSHMAASPGCPDVREELFIQGTQPQFYCNVHGDGASVTGLNEDFGASTDMDIESLAQENAVIPDPESLAQADDDDDDDDENTGTGQEMADIQNAGTDQGLNNNGTMVIYNSDSTVIIRPEGLSRNDAAQDTAGMQNNSDSLQAGADNSLQTGVENSAQGGAENSLQGGVENSVQGGLNENPDSGEYLADTSTAGEDVIMIIP